MNIDYQAIKEQSLALFREELEDNLVLVENGLLELERKPADQSLINEVFRGLHTIKGASAMQGMEQIAGFTHDLENAFDRVREGVLTLGADLMELTLGSLDLIRRMAAADGEPDDVDRHFMQRTRDAVTRIIGGVGVASGDPDAAADNGLPEEADDGGGEGGFNLYLIEFEPAAGLARRGVNLLGLLEDIAALGESACFPDLSRLPPLDALETDTVYLGWRLLLLSEQPLLEVREEFIFVEADSRVELALLAEGLDRTAGEVALKRLTAELEAQPQMDAESLKGRLRRHGKPADDPLAQPQDRRVSEDRRMAKTDHGAGEKTFVRVPAERLDEQVDLVGELVIAQASLGQLAALREDNRLTAIAETIERLSANLRDNTMRLRMVPIGELFTRFRRVVRDLSVGLDKDIQLRTTGDETELDKTVIEKLFDPLVHLIRNCADHAIESPEERERAGKPREGVIHLSATHAGAEVVVRVSDDGRGLDREAIRARALQRGLIATETELTDEDIYGLIFLPGFSTAEQVSNLSGRGVGMDVVRRTVETLHGNVVVQSTPGEGTRITFYLPLTTAIIDGLLVEVGDSRFVLPLNLVEEVVELRQIQAQSRSRRQMINIRDRIVPYVFLRDLFEIEEERDPFERIVIVEGAGGYRAGMVVDRIIGQHQTVIKRLSKVYRDVEAISGATILGDGTVAMILDVEHILRLAEAEEQDAVSHGQ